MKWFRGLIVAAFCVFGASVCNAASAPIAKSHGITASVAATDVELFQIKNAKVLHSDEEVRQAWWQSVVQQSVVAGVSFQGIGDVSGSAAFMWGSCARAYSLALASTSTSLCDLVQGPSGASPGTAVGTLRGSASGFVDLTAYFAGSVTPAAACALITGGCAVAKLYDQIGGTGGWSNATSSQQPLLAFNAQNGLPGWTCVAANNSFLATTGITQPLPFTYVAVAKRTANFTTAQAIMGWGGGASNAVLEFTTSANTAGVSAAGTVFVTLGSVADSSFHAMQGYTDAANTASLLSVDGVDSSTAATGIDTPSSSPARVCRYSGGSSLDGVMMEAGVWTSAFDGAHRTSINSNMHGANGYNF